MSSTRVATQLYPLRFTPIYQYRLWGGRHLEDLLPEPLPGDEPIGEAWILSDRDDHPSQVADGDLKGKTIKDLIELAPEELLGDQAAKYKRFPLLLKFLDAKEMLSVQVHPTDEQKQFLPPGEVGKTEAWIVLSSEPKSEIYAGLKPGTTADNLRALNSETADKYLASFHPTEGDGVFIHAGSVHALGGGVVVFEIQENSDVTFRLYDWDRVDPKTGQSRELHVDDAIACIDFNQGEIEPVTPVVESTGPIWRDRLFACEFFVLNRLVANAAFFSGATDKPTILVCIEGEGTLKSGGSDYPFRMGEVFLLPAALGQCQCIPTEKMTVLEAWIP
jgi:mannose-6-phosphate isomerase